MACQHVYADTGFDTCPYCGADTHETDWKLEAELHRRWIADGKAKFTGWWSI